jgi:dTMP kinase
MTSRRGTYIALEGAEGCGKSTQAKLLAAALGGTLDPVLTRESGGTRIGLQVRNILHDPRNSELVAHAEALLLAADRAQHLRQVVEPALAGGRHVVSDRSVYSSLAYQGYGRGLPLDEVKSINEWAVGGRWPDIVVLLEVGPDVVQQRMGGRDLDRFERESAAFFAKVAAGFAEMAAAEPDRWIVVDGNGSIADVAAEVKRLVLPRIPAEDPAT